MGEHASDGQQTEGGVMALQDSFRRWLTYSVGKDPSSAAVRDWFQTVALSARERVVDRWMETTRAGYRQDVKRVYYLSLEFLVGRLLTTTLANLDLLDACRAGLAEFGIDLDSVAESEPDAALGNGGLGRLAACFLDSMATLGLPAMGYGIRYDYGLFEQKFNDGWQTEFPENWLQFGNPWEFRRPEVLYPVQFHGRVVEGTGEDGRVRHRWIDASRVLAMAFDTPVVGFGAKQVNTLRLWSARATSEFNFQYFNDGDYIKAVENRIHSENLSRVLYPNDSLQAGRDLRFQQEYFFVSASIQDIIRRFCVSYRDFSTLPDKVAIQLNDTHPAIAIAEMMHRLVDEHDLAWDLAWDLTSNVFGYTNHTLLPEALETWPVALIERFLPRHMQIIYNINSRFLGRARLNNTDGGRLQRLSLIDEQGERRVRMGSLAFLGSHRVNGVSALHTELMRTTVFADMAQEFPDRIINQTNGITPRRWLVQANPPLTKLIREVLGPGFENDLDRLTTLAPMAEDAAFRARFLSAKAANKVRLAGEIHRVTGVTIDPSAMFDVQIKRIHEYKRQLLNILHVVDLYLRIIDGDWDRNIKIVKIFAGKAAPSYRIAKLIIKLINNVAKIINEDKRVGDRLKVIMLPNYNVSLAERIIPAADVSEQISTAGMEASGTGNMKLSLNGALTIGTLDGANIEIRDRVGAENIFVFGMTAAEVTQARQQGYRPTEVIAANPRLRRALEAIANGAFAPDDPTCFQAIGSLLSDHGDYFLVTADFADYVNAQEALHDLYQETEEWSRRAVLNTAAMGWFSSDRTVRGYAQDVWQAVPLRSG